MRSALDKLTGMVERLMEKVEKLEVAPPVPKQGEQPDDRLRQFLGGKVSGLVALVGSVATIGPLLAPLALGLLRRLPLPSAEAPARTLSELVRPALPAAAVIALVALLVLASDRIKPKSHRLQFVRGVVVCYSIATVSYMAWVSLSFLRHDTLPSGVLLALTWVAIISILRRAPAGLGEMRELIRVQTTKEKEQTAEPDPPQPALK